MHAYLKLQIYLYTLVKFESLDAMISNVDHKQYMSTLDDILKFESLATTETNMYINCVVLKFESLVV